VPLFVVAIPIIEPRLFKSQSPNKCIVDLIRRYANNIQGMPSKRRQSEIYEQGLYDQRKHLRLGILRTTEHLPAITFYTSSKVVPSVGVNLERRGVKSVESVDIILPTCYGTKKRRTC